MTGYDWFILVAAIPGTLFGLGALFIMACVLFGYVRDLW